MTIDPLNITDYDRTEEELEVFWLFCIMVAGKSAEQIADKVMRLVGQKPAWQSPLYWLGKLEATSLHNLLVAHRIGQYGRIEGAIRATADLLATRHMSDLGLEDLIAIPGVGPKTTRFFLVHSRPGQELAILDTHILRWLREHNVEAPTVTPQDPGKYAYLERIYLNLAKAYYPGLTPAQRDLLIWAQMSGRLAA